MKMMEKISEGAVEENSPTNQDPSMVTSLKNCNELFMPFLMVVLTKFPQALREVLQEA